MKLIAFTLKLSLATTLLAIGGCANFGAQHPLQEPVQADSLHLSAATVPHINPQWWRAAGDPLLNELMDKTLADSPDLALAQAKVREAEALMRGAESQSGPQVGGMVGFDRQLFSGYGLMGGMVGNNFVNTYNVMLKGSWAFDFWGEHRNTVAAILGKRNAGLLEAEQAKLGLAQAVFSQYSAWQNLNAQRAILEERLKLAQETEKLLSRRSGAGITAYSQVYPSQQSAAQLQAQIEVIEAQSQNLRHALCALSGQTPYALDDRSPKPLNAFRLPEIPVGQLGVDLLGRRPDIAAQREALSAQMHQIKAAKAQFYPNLKIEAFAGLQSIATGAPSLVHMGAPASFDLGKLFSGYARALDFAPSITLPIFTSGALQSNLAQKNAQYDAQVAVYNKTVYNALRDAATAVSDYRRAQAEVVARTRGEAAARKAAAAQLRRVQAGIDNRLLYLKQQDQALAQAGEALAARAKLTAAYGTLNTALGGGWAAPQPEPAAVTAAIADRKAP